MNSAGPGIALWVTLVSAILSGLFGALLTTVVYVRREDRKFKVETLKRFASNRFDLQGDEFSRALNEILIVFNDSPRVIAALGEFHEAISSSGVIPSDDRLVRLFKTMCDACKISYVTVNDSFFLRPFNTRPGSTGG